MAKPATKYSNITRTLLCVALLDTDSEFVPKMRNRKTHVSESSMFLAPLRAQRGRLRAQSTHVSKRVRKSTRLSALSHNTLLQGSNTHLECTPRASTGQARPSLADVTSHLARFGLCNSSGSYFGEDADVGGHEPALAEPGQTKWKPPHRLAHPQIPPITSRRGPWNSRNAYRFGLQAGHESLTELLWRERPEQTPLGAPKAFCRRLRPPQPSVWGEP